MLEYISAVEELSKIERDYPVMDIKYRGVSVWPQLRIYFVNKLFKDKQPQSISGNYKLVLKTLFSFNPLSAFKRHDFWAMFATADRKKIGDKYVDSVCGYFSDLKANMLFIEKADKVIGHYKKTEVPERDIISTSCFFLFIYSIERLLRIKSFRLENEDVIKKILKDYDVEFDYRYYVRVLVAQRMVANWFLSITPKPKLVFIEAPYVYMGFVWAFKNKGIPVVELQHGVLNAHHYAYNSIHHNDLLMPDEICVFGTREYNYFTEVNKNYCNKVTITGSYILEKSDAYFDKDIFKEERRVYKYIIVSSGQVGQEKDLLGLIEDISKRHEEILFVHIPRNSNDEISSDLANVRVVKGVNIYEYLKWCNIHMTISSTTCLESHYFKKPNVFYNLNRISAEYYIDVIGNKNGAFYIESVEGFDEAMAQIKSSKFEYLELFAHHSTNNIKKVLERYLC